MDPFEYRVLVMFSSAYRLWKKTRLRHFESWVANWAIEELYAGVGGQGAEDDSYATVVLTEDIHLKGQHLTGGSVDIYK